MSDSPQTAAADGRSTDAPCRTDDRSRNDGAADPSRQPDAVRPRTVRDRLAGVTDPALNEDIVSLGLVDDVAVRSGCIVLRVGLYAPHAPDERWILSAIHETLDPFDRDVVVLASPRVRRPSGGPVGPAVRNVVPLVGASPTRTVRAVAADVAVGLTAQDVRVGVLDPNDRGPPLVDAATVDGETAPTPSTSGSAERDSPHPVTVRGIRTLSPSIRRATTDVPGSDVAGSDDRGADDPTESAKALVERLAVDAEWGELDYLLIPVSAECHALVDAVFNVLDPTVAAAVAAHDAAVTDRRRPIDAIRDHDAVPLGIVEAVSAERPRPVPTDTTDPAQRASAAPSGRRGGSRPDAADATTPRTLGRVPIDPAPDATVVAAIDGVVDDTSADDSASGGKSVATDDGASSVDRTAGELIDAVGAAKRYIHVT